MNKIIVFTVFTLIFIGPNFSQEEIDIKETFSDAEYFFSYGEYSEALYLYRRIYNLDTTNAHISYKTGMCYLLIPGEEHLAIPYFKTALEDLTTKQKYKERSYMETKAPLHTYFYLGNAYRINNELDKALQAYEAFQSDPEFEGNYNLGLVEREIAVCEQAKLIRDKPINIRETNLGEIINSTASNYNAVVSGNESSIVYVTSMTFQDALFHSTKVDGEWTLTDNILPQIGSDGDSYPTGLSFDGSELFLVKRERNNSDIYYSKFENNRWTLMQPLNDNINSSRLESHASVSTDGKTLFFSSNRRGGEGNLDIYKSVRDNSGEWGEVINLGPIINTSSNEDIPFLSEDGEKLFFSSEGHNNMGGYDIFFSVLQEDNTWSVPENMGYPINTTSDNLFYVPAKNGQAGYYSKVRPGGYGKEDIYYVELLSDESEIKPDKKELIKKEEIIEPGDDVIISIIESSQSDTIAVISLDKLNNKYSYITYDNYNIDFQSISAKESVTPDQTVENQNKEPDSDPGLETGISYNQYIPIRSIFFDFDQYSINNTARKELERLFVIMNNNPSLKFEVVGYTDSKGTEEYNLLLSENRTNSVINFLAQKGIEKKRFVPKALGESNHIAINENSDGTDNPEGRSYNQRVDLKILESDNQYIISEEIFIPDHLIIVK